LAERIAWARRHGVRPPDFAIAQARAAGIELSLVADTCNAKEPTAGCCAEEMLAAKPNCCADGHVAVRAEEATRADEANHLVAWRALACRGLAMQWLAAVPTLIMPPNELLNDLPLVERRAPVVSEVADGVSDSPDVPPPEVA
jgi:hypothetical protein